MKLTSGCEIKGKAHRGDSSGCSGGGARCTVRVYIAIQLVPLSVFPGKSDAVRLLRSGRRDTGSISARCLIYLFIRSSLRRLRPLINPCSHSTSTINPTVRSKGGNKKLPRIITIDKAVPCQNFQLTRSVVIPSKVD